MQLVCTLDRPMSSRGTPAQREHRRRTNWPRAAVGQNSISADSSRAARRPRIQSVHASRPSRFSKKQRPCPSMVPCALSHGRRTPASTSRADWALVRLTCSSELAYDRAIWGVVSQLTRASAGQTRPRHRRARGSSCLERLELCLRQALCTLYHGVLLSAAQSARHRAASLAATDTCELWPLGRTMTIPACGGHAYSFSRARRITLFALVFGTPSPEAMDGGAR